MQHPRKVMIDLSSDNRSKEKHPGPGCLQTHALELTSINSEGASGNHLVWFAYIIGLSS